MDCFGADVEKSSHLPGRARREDSIKSHPNSLLSLRLLVQVFMDLEAKMSTSKKIFFDGEEASENNLRKRNF